MPEYNSAFTADRIKQLLKERKMSVSKMLTDCDINKNALYTMQASGFTSPRGSPRPHRGLSELFGRLPARQNGQSRCE